MADINQFRNGMARLAGAVNVVTTDGEAGMAGITATAVCSVTDQPPTLLVCMNRNSHAHPIFVSNGQLCVNVLAADQQEVSSLFANRSVTMDERFKRIRWSCLSTGSPLVTDALVNFDCRIVNMHEAGSHSVFLCEVVQVLHGDAGAGLVYFDRQYHGVGMPAADTGIARTVQANA